MNRANREFLKSAFVKHLKKKLPFSNSSSMSISFKTPSSTKNTKTFLPKVSRSVKKSQEEATAPIILVDLKETEMNKYFQNQEIQNSKKFLFVKSVYSNRSANQIFYFSNDFSNYYKEDLKQFSSKFKLVKSRIPIKKTQLKKAIAISKHNSNVLKPPVLKQIFEVTDKEVNHVNCSNDATSLVLKILNQINPIKEADLIQQIKPKKYYYRTNKPLGNSEEEHIDYTINRRYNHSEEIKVLFRQAREKENEIRLSLSTYNSNDKDILLFDKAEKGLENENNNHDVINKQTGDQMFQTSIFNNLINKAFDDNKSQSILTTNTLLNKTFKRTNSANIKPFSFKLNRKSSQRKSNIIK